MPARIDIAEDSYPLTLPRWMMDEVRAVSREDGSTIKQFFNEATKHELERRKGLLAAIRKPLGAAS